MPKICVFIVWVIIWQCLASIIMKQPVKQSAINAVAIIFIYLTIQITMGTL